MAAGFGEGVSDVSDVPGAAVVDWRESDRRWREGEKRRSSIRGGEGCGEGEQRVQRGTRLRKAKQRWGRGW